MFPVKNVNVQLSYHHSFRSRMKKKYNYEYGLYNYICVSLTGQGEAAIITAYDEEAEEDKDLPKRKGDSRYNEGQQIKWLISAPTMRVPLEVMDTAHSYLAFRAIILAGILLGCRILERNNVG